MTYIKYAITTAITVLVLMSISITMAQEDASLQTIAIDASDSGITVPTEISGGLIQIEYTNQATNPALLSLARLNPDVTRDQLLSSLQESGPEASIRLITLLGAPLLLPETTAQATYMLEEGTHIVLNLAGEIPQFTFFDVTAAASDMEAEPEADVTVTLSDFSFTMPIEVSSGEQTWLIENMGHQWHEMTITRIEEGTSVEELQTRISEAVLQATENINSLQPSTFLTPVDAGQRVWLALNLEPGTYVVLCFLPDILETGHPHAIKGMVQIITVTE